MAANTVVETSPGTVVVTGGSLVQNVISVNGKTGALSLSASDVSAPSLAQLAAVGTGNGANIVGFQQSLAGAIQRSIQAKAQEWVSVKDFGAICDGVTDDTAAINAALASGASRVRFVGTCLVSKTLYYPANITIEFDRNAQVVPVALGSFQQLTLNGVAWGYAIFMNQNWQASSITDRNVTFINPRCAPSSAWNGHFIGARNLQNLNVTGSYVTNVADAVASLSCQDVVIRDGWSNNTSNCAYDFWEGPQRISVLNCTVYNGNCGVNFNATDTTKTQSLNADSLLVQGNRFYSCATSGVTVSPLSSGSSCSNIKILNNVVDQTGGVWNVPTGATWNGFTVQRSTGVEIRGNTITHVTAVGAAPILVGLDANGYGNTADVTDNTLQTCTVGTNFYIQVYGPSSKVWNNRALNSTAIGGAGIAVNNANTVVGPNDMTGASTYLVNQNQDGSAASACLELNQDTVNGQWYSSSPFKAASLREPTTYGASALGTTQATALALTTPYTYVSGGATNSGVVLPSNSSRVGEEWIVWNQAGGNIIVYAATGDTIAGSASQTLATSTKARFVAVGPNLWMPG